MDPEAIVHHPGAGRPGAPTGRAQRPSAAPTAMPSGRPLRQAGALGPEILTAEGR
ncbi:hypothetical protein SBADM41S_01550 [Streptomyces badius]